MVSTLLLKLFNRRKLNVLLIVHHLKILPVFFHNIILRIFAIKCAVVWNTSETVHIKSFNFISKHVYIYDIRVHLILNLVGKGVSFVQRQAVYCGIIHLP